MNCVYIFEYRTHIHIHTIHENIIYKYYKI